MYALFSRLLSYANPITAYLSKSKYLDDLEYIIRCFDENTKIRFKSDKDPQYVKFATTRDNDPACNIRFGQLRLEGYV